MLIKLAIFCRITTVEGREEEMMIAILKDIVEVAHMIQITQMIGIGAVVVGGVDDMRIVMMTTVALPHLREVVVVVVAAAVVDLVPRHKIGTRINMIEDVDFQGHVLDRVHPLEEIETLIVLHVGPTQAMVQCIHPQHLLGSLDPSLHHLLLAIIRVSLNSGQHHKHRLHLQPL
jgi:hypothetical protein